MSKKKTHLDEKAKAYKIQKAKERRWYHFAKDPVLQSAREAFLRPAYSCVTKTN